MTNSRERGRVEGIELSKWNVKKRTRLMYLYIRRDPSTLIDIDFQDDKYET